MSVGGSDDAMYLERLLQSKDLKAHKNFQSSKQRNGTFIVHHYADTVTYAVEDFCEKNKDQLVSNIAFMMQVWLEM
jgi:myosin heavy subunit